MEYSSLLILCKEFNKSQPGLDMIYTKNGITFHGNYKFYSVEPIYGIEMEDEYLLKIELDFDYPNILPVVYEIGSKIYKYPHKYENDMLCLSVETEMRLFLKQNCDLRMFMDTYVTNYLFNYSAYKKYGFLPLGERSHHNAGVKEFYQEYFDILDLRAILIFLRDITINPKVNQNEICACGSNKRIKYCHGEKISRLINAVPIEYLEADLRSLEVY